MKKGIALILAFLMLFALVACGKSATDTKTTSPDSSASGKPASSSGTPGTSTGNQPTYNPPSSTASEAAEGKKFYPSDTAVLNVAANTNPTVLTQVGQGYAATSFCTTLFHETLCRWDAATNNGKPGLAKSWEWLNDKTLRLYLNEGIKSTNGDPFTASDVVFSFKYNSGVKTLSSYYSFFDMENTKAVDDYTVDLALKDVYPYLVMDLAHSAYEVIVEKSAEAAGGVEALAMNPIAGTGPYKFIKFDDGVCLYAERKDDYWDTLPYYKYLNIHIVTDANARYMGIEAGDYQVCLNASMTSVEAAQNDPNVTAWTFKHVGRGIGFQMNSDREYLKVLEVRQAIGLAIDYEAIIKVACSGFGAVSQGAILNQYSPWFTPPTDMSKRFVGRHDLELAKQKMIDAGYPDGFKITCKLKPSDSTNTKAAEIIHNNLSQIGIDLEIVLCEAAKFTADCRAGDWDTTIAGGGNPNPKRKLTTIDPRLDHNQANGSMGQNWFGDVDVVSLIDRCANTPDGPELVKAWAELDALCAERVPNITIALPYATIITSSDIVGVDIISMGTPDYGFIYPQAYLDGPAK